MYCTYIGNSCQYFTLHSHSIEHERIDQDTLIIFELHSQARIYHQQSDRRCKAVVHGEA